MELSCPFLVSYWGGINIADKSFTLGDAVVKWGGFLQAIIDFTIIAFAIFIAIKFVNMLKNTEEKEQSPILSHQEVLLMEIRDLLKDKIKPT